MQGSFVLVRYLSKTVVVQLNEPVVFVKLGIIRGKKRPTCYLKLTLYKRCIFILLVIETVFVLHIDMVCNCCHQCGPDVWKPQEPLGKRCRMDTCSVERFCMIWQKIGGRGIEENNEI